MDPITDVTLGLKLLDLVIGWVRQRQAQAGMTGDQIIAHAEAQDLQNKDAIKALLAL